MTPTKGRDGQYGIVGMAVFQPFLVWEGLGLQVNYVVCSGRGLQVEREENNQWDKVKVLVPAKTRGIKMESPGRGLVFERQFFRAWKKRGERRSGSRKLHS